MLHFRVESKLHFSNPGRLLVSIAQLLRGNISECRNKSLQTMFTLMGAAEKAGSGVDKIRRGWAAQHWQLPMVHELTRPDRVCWHLPMVSLISPKTQARLEQRFGDELKSFSGDEIKVLAIAEAENTVDNGRVQQISNLHPTEVTQVLQGLVAKQALVQTGQTRGARYHLPDDPWPEERGLTPNIRGLAPNIRGLAPNIRGLAPNIRGLAPNIRGLAPNIRGLAPNIKGTSSEHKGTSSEHKGTSSEHKGASSEHKGASSEHKGASSEHKGASSEHKGASSEHKGASSEHKGGLAPNIRGLAPNIRGELAPNISGSGPSVTRRYGR